MRTALLLVALVASSACTRVREDVGGTYVVDGELTVDAEGATSRTTIAKETITVKLTSRAYQYGTYEVTVRGCTMTGQGTLVPAVVMTPQCTLDGPSGAITVQASGDIKPTSGGGVDVYVLGPLRDGDGGFMGSFHYKVHGVPKGP